MAGKKRKRATVIGWTAGRWPKELIRARTTALFACLLLMLALLPLSSPAQGHVVLPEVRDLRAYAGESFVELTWSPPDFSEDYNLSGSMQYQIYRGADGANMTLYKTGWNTGFIDLSVTVGIAYRYKVSVLTEQGEGPGSIVDAHPRPAPNIISYSPVQVEDCDQFTATLEWSPPSDTTSVVGYHIYTYPGMPLNASADASNISFELGGWGPHIIRLSAVYADGNESFAEPAYIGGPICEGGYSPLDYLILLLPLFLFAGGTMVAALVILDRRKRS